MYSCLKRGFVFYALMFRSCAEGRPREIHVRGSTGRERNGEEEATKVLYGERLSNQRSARGERERRYMHIQD